MGDEVVNAVGRRLKRGIDEENACDVCVGDADSVANPRKTSW